MPNSDLLNIGRPFGASKYSTSGDSNPGDVGVDVGVTVTVRGVDYFFML